MYRKDKILWLLSKGESKLIKNRSITINQSVEIEPCTCIKPLLCFMWCIEEVKMLQTERVFMLCFVLILVSSHSLVSCLQTFQKILLPPPITGPEAFAFDSHGGGPYTGVSGGKILKYQGPTLGFVEFAYTSPIAYVLVQYWNRLIFYIHTSILIFVIA